MEMENVRRISKKYCFKEAVVWFLVCCLFFNTSAPLALATPAYNGQVAGTGIGGVSAVADTTTVDMGPSGRAVLHWDDLDTSTSEVLEFIKGGGSNFAVLNRVIAGDATQFNGSLLGNQGDIFIVNTRGLIFGPESYIQARSFVGSAIDIRDRSFMVADGQFRFERFTATEENPFSNQIGDVTNEGIGTDHGIHAEQVALIGQNVTNKGAIVATGRNNAVVLAAGESVYLGRDGSDVVVEVAMTTPADHVVDNGGSLGTGAGTIEADGGKVILAAGDIFSTAISGIESLRAVAKRDITLHGTPTSVSADGTLTLIADSDDNHDGDLTVDGALYGNMELSGYDVTVEGDVISDGTLDVDADDDIKLKANVSSVGAMTMNAGDNIELNRSSGNTSSESTITLTAADDITIGKSSSSEGNVTANGHMAINAGSGSRDDVKVYGKLTTLESSGGNITVTAGGDIKVYETGGESAQADGTLTMTAGDDLYAAGSLVGNMSLSGDDVTVDGDVTSFGILDVDADDDIRLKSNVSSVGAMTMNAGDDITLNEDVGDTTSDSDMTINAGGSVTAYNNLTTTGDNGAGNMLVEGENIHVGGNADAAGSMTMTATGDDELFLASGSMNGSIKIEGYAKSKYDMEMTASGGDKSLVLFDLSNEVMNGSISIGEYAKSTRGNMTMSADGGDVLETVTLIGPGTVLMNGSISIGDYAESKYDMLMTATGGSEGFDIILPDALDFDGMNGSIKIGTDAKSRYGAMTMTAEGGGEYLTNDDVDIDLMDGSIKIGGDATSKRDMLLTANGGSEVLTEDGIDVDGMNGSILIGDDARSLFGSVTMTAEGGSEILTSDEWDVAGMNGSIKIGDDVTAMFHLELSAKGGSDILTADKYDIDGMNGSIWIGGDAKSYLDGVTMTAEGGSEILTYDEWDVDGMNGSIKFGGDVTSTSNMDLSARGGSDILTVDKFDIDGMNGSIKIGDDAKSLFGSVTMTAEGGGELLAGDLVDIDGMNGSIKIGDDVTSMFSMNLSAKGGSEIGTLDLFDGDVMNGSIKIGGDAESWLGGVKMTAEGGKEILSADLVDIDVMNGSIKIGGHVKSKYDLELTAKGGCEFLTADGLDFDLMNGSIFIGDYVRSGHGAVTLTAEGTDEILTYDGLDLDLMNGSIFVGGYIKSQDDTIISAQGGREIWAGDHYDFSLLSGDVVVLDDIQSYGGNVEIYSSDDTTFLGGDVTAFSNVLLNNNTEFISTDDQHVTAETGSVTAKGYLEKPKDGSLYLLANEDIRLDDHVTVENGGISIIAETGKIFTGFGGDTLNVDITGTSDHMLGIGVDLPKDYDQPPPAAAGEYETGKAAIVIMSEEALKLGPDGTLTARGTYYGDGSVDDRPGVDFANYNRTNRPGGDPIDVAIYLASNSRVPVDLPAFDYEGDVHVGSPVADLPDGAVMVVDAYDTVTFGDAFETSLDNGNVDWLEVCSRISPTYVFARDRDKLPKSEGKSWILGNYVWRGEGGGDDGGAWVLENPPAPLYTEAGERAEEQGFDEGGCPALMNWLAGELGIEEDQIEVTVANAFAYSTDIQPCEMCARLKDAATILEDAEGTGVAGLVQVVNEFVATPAPPSEEQMASIATAFADHTDDGTYYAAAGEWTDALVEYVGILTLEMGYSAEESTGYANKYIGPATDTGNASLIAYVEARLAALGG